MLRRRTDLPPSAVRAIESFGSTDFAPGHEAAEAVALDAPAAPVMVDAPDAPAFRPIADIAAARTGAGPGWRGRPRGAAPVRDRRPRRPHRRLSARSCAA
ncbi:hypothetical protein AB5I41_04505 [Sphingomonas sp. MMS24-JH45]